MFCDAFRVAVLNIHPSLLPAFPGMNAQHRRLAHGVKVSGVTVHFVTPELDAGPDPPAGAGPVLDDDTGERCRRAILVEEHRCIPRRFNACSWRVADGARGWPSPRAYLQAESVAQ